MERIDSGESWLKLRYRFVDCEEVAFPGEWVDVIGEYLSPPRWV